MMKEPETLCGECKFNHYDGNGGFSCNNPESEYYGVPTFYDAHCDRGREKQ